MHQVQYEETVIVSGKGCWVKDVEGREYLDGSGSLWYCSVGHGRPEIAEAAGSQMAKLDAFMVFNDYANQPALELCERLAAISPQDDPRVFLTSGGGDGIDTAVKLARRYWSALDQPQRTHVIARRGGYHGTHGYGTSIAGADHFQEGFGPMDPDVHLVERDSFDDLKATVEKLGVDNVAAIVTEPVQGTGGVYAPAEGYLAAIEDLCDQTRILFVADEVICGFGRLGEWFGSERWNVTPDVLVAAKGITSGYLPLGAVIVADRVASPFFDEPDGPVLMHGQTYSGHPVCCAVASKNLDILEQENLVSRAYEVEADLASAVRDAVGSSSLVTEVRAGVGLLAAVELDADRLSETPGLSAELFRACRKHGLLVRGLPTVIAVSPPLIVSKEELGQLSERMHAAFSEVEARLSEARVSGV